MNHTLLAVSYPKISKWTIFPACVLTLVLSSDLPVVVNHLIWIIPIESSSCHFLQFVLELLVLPLEVNNDRIQKLNLSRKKTVVLI